MATFTLLQKLRGLSFISLTLLAACGDGGFGSSGEQAPDPVAIDVPIAYIKRTLQVDEDTGEFIGSDLREPFEFSPGARLVIRDRASPSSPEVDITAGTFPADELYDVRDPFVSYDGSKIVFAMRAPEIPNADEDEQPTWNIWEYNRNERSLKRVIASDIVAEDGQDISPIYLADGRILFASTRQRQSKAILLDEGKPQFSHLDEDRNVEAVTLHVMNADGSSIRQVTFNQSHDMYPNLLPNGRVVFMRWDNAGNRSGMHLYSMKPDGSDLQLMYGMHSHLTGTNASEIQFFTPKPLQDGRILSIIRPFDTVLGGGDFVGIDVATYIDNQQAIASRTGMTGPAQVSLAPAAITTDGTPSLAGRYRDIEPMFDGTGRFLVSWSQCRLLENAGTPAQRIIPCTADALAQPTVMEAAPLFSLYLYDPSAKTQTPIFLPVEGEQVTNPVALVPRATPTFIPDARPGIDVEQSFVDENVGVLHIKSVYDLDGVDVTAAAGGITVLRDPAQTLAAARPARFIRIMKPVSMPDDDIYDFDNSAFGFTQAFGMQDILGYVPVEPDGSAMFKVPANVAFTLHILDGNGRRIPGFQRHNNLLQINAGEVRQCNGCHTNASTLPHGRADAEAQSINTGLPGNGNFPNTESALWGDMGETMAQVYTRQNGPRTPSLNIEFDDEWTDPAVRAKDPSIAWLYSDLSTPAPTSASCLTAWSNLCRGTINYLSHIQPIWNLDRPVIDPVTNMPVIDPITGEPVVNTCITCHSRADSAGAAQVPAAQLELTDNQSADDPDYVTSFFHLLRAHQAVELDAMGNLIGSTTETRTPAIPDPNNPGQFICNAGILDPLSNECVVTTAINAAPTMRIASSITSTRFFNRFAPGADHYGRLNDAELKLLKEWLDIGSQYYNNPFEAPED